MIRPAPDRSARPRIPRRRARRDALWAAAFALLALAAAGCRGVEQRLDEARSLQDAGLYLESIDPLKALLEEAPDNAEANELLGVAYLQTNQPSLAVYPLEKAARSPEHAIVVGTLLAIAYSRTDLFESAVGAADRVLAVAPDHHVARYLRAQAYLSMGRREQALEDADRLLEATPNDYQALLLRAATLWDLKRLDEAEQAYLRLKEAAEGQGPDVRLKGWLALATFYRNKGDAARAEQEFAAILEQYPTDPTALSYAMQFYDETDRSERATALAREAVRASPETPALRFSLAARLQSQGDAKGAEAVLEEAANLFGTPDTWLHLVELRQQQGRHDAALEALDEVVRQVGEGNDQVNLKRAQLLAAAGRTEQAREVLATVKEDTARELVEGQLLLTEGQPEQALARLDAGLRRWPNNTAARVLAGQAALQLGQLDRAASEFREAYRAGPKETDAALRLADLEFRRGNLQEAFEFASLHVQERGSVDPAGNVEALSIVIRSATALGSFDAARRGAARLAELPGQAARAVVERAGIERQESGAKAAIAVVEESGLDLTAPENEPALRTLVADLTAEARLDEAARRVEAATTAHPDHAAFQELRGVVAARRGRLAEAGEAFERALALDPTLASALAAQAELAAGQGNLDAALALLAKAEAAAPGDPSHPYHAAQLLLAADRTAEAETRLRELVGAHPTHAAARNDLAWILADRNADLDLALRLAQEASAMMPTADTLDTLGWVQLRRGDAAAAVESFRRALAAGESPSIRYRLGLALRETGDSEQALHEIEASLSTGGEFPEAQAARAEAARLQQTRGETKENPSS